MRFSVLALLLLALPRPAAAADGGLAPADEIRTLEAQIAVALEAHGCAVACDALASMTRAADRLCALDPGPRCEDARARVRDAQRRVLEACPECAVIGGSLTPPVQANKDGRPSSPATPSSVPPPAPPAAEMEYVSGRRGGCAGCVVGGDGGVPAEALLAGVGLLAALARRRRSR